VEDDGELMREVREPWAFRDDNIPSTLIYPAHADSGHWYNYIDYSRFENMIIYFFIILDLQIITFCFTDKHKIHLTVISYLRSTISAKHTTPSYFVCRFETQHPNQVYCSSQTAITYTIMAVAISVCSVTNHYFTV
jgi:hypothetical protein